MFQPACVLHAGIVQGQGQVEAVDSKDDFSSIRIRFPPGKLDGVQVGASVAVNGTCLTVRLDALLSVHCVCSYSLSALPSTETEELLSAGRLALCVCAAPERLTVQHLSAAGDGAGR